MTYKYILFPALSFALGTVASGWNNVSRTQFKSIVEENDLTLVAFVAPWTESSKALEPEWSSAAAQTNKPFVAIDCTVESSLCEENDINSYPTIRLFRKSNAVTRYRGLRKSSEIVAFINRSALPAVSFLDSKNITNFKSVDEAVFIAYLPKGNSALRSSFVEHATRHQSRFTFGLATDAKLAKAENIPIPSVVCYRTRDGEQSIFSTDWNANGGLEEFVASSTIPLIGQLTRKNERKYLQAGKSLVYIFALTEKERSKYRVTLAPLAKRYREYLNFVTIDANEYAHIALALGLQAGKFPALALQNPMFGQIFPYNQKRAITPETVEKFVLDIVEGKTKPFGEAVGAEGMTHDDL